MITSEIQYAAAQNKLAVLHQSLEAQVKPDVPAAIANASKAQINGLIGQIENELAEYVQLKGSDPSQIRINCLDDLMLTPIRYRLAANLSVDAFGRKVDVSARQIARYEQEGYRNTNTMTLHKILQALNIRLDGQVCDEDTA